MNRHIESHLPGATAIVILMAAALLIPWLGETLFNSKGEPREALVAVSMLQDGDWILPRNFGTDIPYKPPFMAWIIASLAWLFNGGMVNEYLSRVPSALACVAMIGGGYFWARSVRGTRFAMIFSLVTLTAVEVFRAGIACRLDMILTACMVGAMYMLFDLTENRRRLPGLRYTAVVALLTVATLTKGPVGALLPCAVAGVYRLLRGRRFFPTFFSMIGLALAAMVIPAMWYYAAYQRGGKEFFDLMMEENFGRLTGNMSYESHENPWWYNFVTLIGGLCPWTLLLLITFFCFRLWTRPPPVQTGGIVLGSRSRSNHRFLLHSCQQTQRLPVAGLSVPMLWHSVPFGRDRISKTHTHIHMDNGSPLRSGTTGCCRTADIPAASASDGHYTRMALFRPRTASCCRYSMDGEPPQSRRTRVGNSMGHVYDIRRRTDARRAESKE